MTENFQMYQELMNNSLWLIEFVHVTYE